MDEVFDLSKFDSYREDNRREVKSAEGGLPASLWDSYSAMANTYGGVIICGVKENKDGTWLPTGMKDVTKLKRNLWNQANDQKKVSANLLSESGVKTYDRIVMSNPGTIIPGKKQMLRGGISEPRNKSIFKMFNLIGIGEHAGSGVPDIFEVWNSEGLKTPEVEEQFGVDVPDRTTLVLPLVEKFHDYHLNHHPGDKVGDNPGDNTTSLWDHRKSAIADLLIEEPKLSIDAISSRLNLTRRQVERSINMLKEEQRLFRDGSARSGHWVVRS